MNSNKNISLAELDDPSRIFQLRSRLNDKKFLKKLYEESYLKFVHCLDQRGLKQGKIIELGAGASFLKNFVPHALLTDTIPYDGIDLVVDAQKMPFSDGELSAIYMMNVFHHIPNVEEFLKEAQRCLCPGGVLYIHDQYPGWLSKWILKYAHHEPFNDKSVLWAFPSSGPLSGANGAMAWLVFYRDYEKFKGMYPGLQVVDRRLHTPLRYWLSGGLKPWSLFGEGAFFVVSKLDNWLARVSGNFCSFVDVIIERL